MSQKRYRILREYANGVMDQENKFYPYFTQSWVASGSLVARYNVRYYIAKVSHSAASTTAAAPVVDKVDVTVRGITSTVSQVTMPIVDASGHNLAVDTDVGVLCDLNTAVTVTIANTSPFCAIKYAEIDEEPGKFV